MDLQPMLNSVSTHARLACNAIKDFAVWSGHKISTGYANYLVPAIQRLWCHAVSLLRTLAHSIKQGHGVTFALAGVLFVAGIAAFKIADHHAYEHDLVSKAAWKTLGIAAFVTATVVTSAAIASLLA